MKPAEFDLIRPTTVQEAVGALADGAADAKLLAGGQSLLPLLNFRLARPTLLIDLDRVAELAVIRRTRHGVSIGAMVRQSLAETSVAVAQDAPLMAAALPNVAHRPIRNRGTVGGSLAHADPAAELPCVAVALDAVLVAIGPRGRREIPAHDFFRTHLTTALEADEMVTEVRIPALPAATGAGFVEVSRRRGDFALVGVAAQVTVVDGYVADARVCFSGVADTPRRCSEAEALLRGEAITAHSLRAAADAARDVLNPPDDLHASGAYRKDVAGSLLERALSQAAKAAGAKHGEPGPR